MAIMKIKIITYNLLSSEFANSINYSFVDSNSLINNNRFKLVCDKLNKHINQSTIFCLQEISLEWVGKLSLFFNEKKFNFNYINYGKNYSGYMGIGIAVPNNIITKDIYIKRVMDLKYWPHHSYSYYDYIKSWLTFTPLDNYDSWVYSQFKNNYIMVYHIQIDKNDIVLANYHMPCAYNNHDIMIMHASLTLKYIDDIAKKIGTPDIIYAGDFNAIIESECYKYLTTGEYDNKIFDRAFPNCDKWRPDNKLFLSSSYKEIHNKEPLYTNNTISNGVPFSGCLDYILFNKNGNFKAKQSNVEECGSPPFPSKKEPSDHLLLWTEFEKK